MRVRIVAAVAVLVSAAVHLYLWPDVRDNDKIGPAFMLNAVGGLIIALLLLFWKHWVPPLLAIGFGVCTITAFTVSATVGMYGVHEHWTGGWVWTALVAEVVAIVAGALALLRERDVHTGSEALPRRAAETTRSR
jgi:hypothetical protein